MEIRLAKPEDSVALTELIWQSDSGIIKALTRNKPEVLESIIRSSADCPTLLFSYDHMVVVEKDGLIAGVCFGYDDHASKLSISPTAKALWKHLGTYQMLKLLPAWVRLAFKTTFQKTDFYLSNIVVYPEHRSLGIGSYLLDYVELHCRQKRVVLDVSDENYGAKKFYIHHGYQKEGEWKFSGKTYIRFAKAVNTEIRI